MTDTSRGDKKRVMLLVQPSTYRGGAFMTAAEKVGLDVIQVLDLPDALAREWGVELGVSFGKPEQASRRILEIIEKQPVDAILSLDDSATVLAAMASNQIGLPHNSPESALAARDKVKMRELLHAYGVPAPQHTEVSIDAVPRSLARDVEFPCVVKPNLLAGSRGVIRANNPEEFEAAFRRTRAILDAEGFTPKTASILVEEYVPGVEVALEGLLTDGELQVLALFDKPDPLDGPFFEETIYLTPSRLSDDVQDAIHDCTQRAAAALGLRQGPVHAELRVNDHGPWIIEIAGRSIGGLCSTILEFGTGQSLEEIILRHAVGQTIESTRRSGAAAGVMMIPIPEAGILRGVKGVEEAEAVPLITGVEISARINHKLVPLPEGASYLGFIFAAGETPDDVEQAIRIAHSKLSFNISRQITLRPE